MITAKDINNKRFEQTRPGYSTAEVDDFLRDIAKEITKYQKDREEMEKKIEVLVESVREYKKDEDALKDALVGAQKQGRAIIAEAQEKANEILAGVNAKADDILGSTKTRLSKEKKNLANMQKQVSDFKSELLSMYKHHLELITAIPEFDDENDEEKQPKAEFEAGASSAPAAAVRPASDETSAPPVYLGGDDALDSFTASNGENENGGLSEGVSAETVKSPFDDLKNPAKAANRFGELKFGNNS